MGIAEVDDRFGPEDAHTKAHARVASAGLRA
jgi:hypothetical protein